MNSNSPVRMLVALSFLPKLNNRLYLPFIEKCGGIEGFFMETEHNLSAACRDFNLSPEAFKRQEVLQKAEKELEQIDKHQISITSIESSNYPALLHQCEDAPLVLFYKGELPPSENNKFLAIVGTRHASVLCQDRVEQIIGELCSMGHFPVIVSGLAFGIDASAHRTSLKYGLKTLAVLGHGLHMVYPATHKGMAGKIIETGGALISEFPCTATTHPTNFLKRNRIIAGLCHATLVAESAIKGGAMSTARLAMSYNREVMVFPGRPNDVYSAGCNFLIKENIAALIENGTDAARILNYPTQTGLPRQTSLNLFGNEDKEQQINGLLQNHSCLHMDELGQLSGMPASELSALLLQMELEGKILALPGRKYSLR